MEINEFIDKFAEQFDDTDRAEFKAETIFHELEEYSSITALSLIGMIDEEYDVALKSEEMRKSVTIEDL